MAKKPIRMFVAPEFKNYVKIKSATSSKTMIQITRELAFDDPFKKLELEYENKFKKKKFDFF